MNDVHRSFITAGIVCAASASLIFGIHARQRVEADAAGIRVASVLEPGLVASNTKDVEISEERFFFDLTALLKREYVDPIEDESVLASGAVKGMISSLNDEQSLFMAEPLFQAFTQTLVGNFEGIGAELTLMRPNGKDDKPIQTSLDFLERVPSVVVTRVAPGGPADTAGIRPGDEIERIDGRWVVNPSVAGQIRRMRELIAKNRAHPSELSALESELRAKFDDSMMPMRALERLMVGELGRVTVQYRRNGQLKEAEMERTRYRIPEPSSKSQAPYPLQFVPGSADALRQAIAKNPAQTLDLRGVRHGDLEEMVKVLAVVAPAGEYGQVVSEKGIVQYVRVVEGASREIPITVQVDQFTAGVAEAFVMALQAKNLVKVEGGPMTGNPSIIERTALPDGSGFSLRIGTFETGDKQ